MNKEFIDAQVDHTGKVVSQQAQQVKSLAGEHAGKGFETVKSYTGDYANMASEYVGKSRQKIPAMQTSTQAPVKADDFPIAPKEEPKEEVPSMAATTEPEPVPAI